VGRGIVGALNGIAVPPPVLFGLELYAKHFHIVVAVFLIVHVDGYSC
jgi:hypothetical protein